MKRLANILLFSGLLGILLAGVNYLSHYPIKIEATEAEVYGEPLLRNVGSNVALVVDTAAIRSAGQSGRFSQTDWSYGWLNLLLQEEKRFDVHDISDLSSAESAAKDVTIVTRSVSQRLNSATKTILYEAPSESLLNELSDGSITIAEAQQSVFSSEYGMTFDLRPLSLDTSRAVALLVIEGVIALAEFNLDGRRIVVSGFDFGEMAVRVQQGLPNDDFSVTAKIVKRTGLLPIVTGDLVSDSAHYERFEPFFDRFEHDFWLRVNPDSETRPLFADSSPGAFIMSHDEEGLGDRSVWQPEQEERWGVNSSVFISPASITREGFQRLIDAGAEINLHPDQYSYFKRPGLPGLRPFRVELAIDKQLETIQKLLPETTSITISRNHWLLWENSYTTPLRKLAAAGIQLDLSYGPLGEGLVGYIFGTAFPFVPIDTNGFPLPILELPFLYQDDERFAAEYVATLMDTSAFREEVINVIFHSNTMGHSPDTLLLWGWRESFRQAKSMGLPIKQYGDILDELRRLDATIPAGILQ